MNNVVSEQDTPTIEITPEMIEAGGEVITCDVHELSEWGTTPSELAVRVFEAMMAARHERL